MKTIIIAVLIGIFSINNLKADNEKSIKTKPEKVTVYLSGAQVFRNSPVNLLSGMNQIVFENLESNIDAESIQAGGNGNFIITEVQYIVKYPELEKLKTIGDSKYQKLVKQLQDSLSDISYEQEDLKNRTDVLLTEKNVLLNYKLFKGESKKDTLAFLKEGLVFLREKLNNINNELLKLKKETQKVELKKKRITDRLAQINTELGNLNHVDMDVNQPNYCIIVNVLADATGQGSLNINYFIDQAGWTPTYDLRTNSVESPVKLTYKAMVHQSSGVDWNNVKLTLSTANPHQNLTLPQLNTWYIDQIYYPKKSAYDYKRKRLETNAPSMAYSSSDKEMDSYNNSNAHQAYEYTNIEENVIQAEFEIKLPYTIPSDSKEHYVSVLSKDLDTKYLYKAIPKLDQNVYLTARVVNWEELSLLPGQAKIFYDGTYIGETTINTGSVDDTLELALGQDKNVTIKRTKTNDKNREKILDNDKMYYSSYEIMVKNGNNKNIEILIEDQLPLSRNKDVVIEKGDLSGAIFDEITGKLSWKQYIKSKDNKKLTFSYSIKAPKDMPIVIR